MAIQTGISIAAIAIAIVAIGVSAAMVSSIGQDMTELKSTIEELSQTQSRGAIDQQEFGDFERPAAPNPISERMEAQLGHDAGLDGVDFISTLPLTKFYEPQFALRAQGMSEVIDILLIAELNVPLNNQDKQGFYKIQKIIETGKMTPKLFNSIKSVIKDISTENDLSYDCQDLSGNLAEFGTETGLSAEDDCPSGTTMCRGVCCDYCIRGTCK